MNLEELFEYVQVWNEYNRIEFNPEVAEKILDEIHDEYEEVLNDCLDLCEDNEVYKNLVLECLDLVDDLRYFNGENNYFFELLENLRNKIEEIMKLLSSKDDDLSNELLHMLDNATTFWLYY